MKNLLHKIQVKPPLFEQSENSIWEDPYISKSMLRAHMNEQVDSATRKLEFVKNSTDWIAAAYPPEAYPCLLDLGCGPGIYAECFHNKGYQVSGIDFSARSIAYAKKSAFEKNLKIYYQQGDYTKLTLPTSTYHLITLIYCDFGVLPKRIREMLLSNIYSSLLPGGVFLFDVYTPQRYADQKERKEWIIEENGFWKDGLCLTLQAFYRYEHVHTFLNQYVNITADDESIYNVWEHTFTLQELKTDLEMAGFTTMKAFGNLAGKPYDEEQDTIGIAAQK